MKGRTWNMRRFGGRYKGGFFNIIPNVTWKISRNISSFQCFISARELFLFSHYSWSYKVGEECKWGECLIYVLMYDERGWRGRWKLWKSWNVLSWQEEVCIIVSCDFTVRFNLHCPSASHFDTNVDRGYRNQICPKLMITSAICVLIWNATVT